MARPYFEILVKETVAGDSIAFTAFGTPTTFLCIGSTPPQRFEYLERGIVSAFPTRAAIAVFAAFINDLSPKYKVEIREQLVIVTATDELAASNFGTITIINGAGSDVTLLKNRDNAGAPVVPDVPISDGSVAVTLITHELPVLYPGVTKDFIFGSLGTGVRTTIEFTLLGTNDFTEFKFGLIRNSTDAYTQGATGEDEFTINPEFFNNLTSGVPNVFRGAVGSLSGGNPLNHLTGNATLTSLGGFDYRIIHDHFIQPFIRPEDLNGFVLQVPQEYLGPESVKYVFEINVKDDAINPSFSESTRFTNITPFLKNGNVGWENEFLNNGPGSYTLTSFVFDTDDGELNQAIDTSATAVIASTEALSAADDILVIMQEVNPADDQTQNLLQNLNFDSVALLLDNTPVSGNNLLNVTADFSGSDITITFDVAAFSYTGDYAIYAIVSTDPVVINHNTVLLKIGSANKSADDSGIIMGTIVGAPFAEFNINKHDDSLLTNAANHIGDAFVGDRFVIRFLIENTDPTITIAQFVTSIVVRTTNVAKDSITVNIGDFDIDNTRDFILNSTSPYNLKRATQTGNDFEFEFGFQTYTQYVGFTDLVVRCEIKGSQLLADGTVLTVNKIFQTADFDVTTYNGTKNTVSEPQMEFLDVKFFEEPAGNEVKALIKGGLTRVEIQHEDNNLNNHGISDEADLRGYLSIKPENGQQLQERQFHNIHLPEADTPWIKITGHPTDNATLTIPDNKTIKGAGIINHNQLKVVFPGVDCFDISFRSDKIQEVEFCITFTTDFDYPADGTFIPEFLTINGDVPEWRFENSTIINDNQIDSDAGVQMSLGLDGTTQEVDCCFTAFSNVVGVDFKGTLLTGIFDLTVLTAMSSYEINSNPNLLQILLPTTAIPVTLMNFQVNILLDNLDISVINLGETFSVFQCNSLSTFTEGNSTNSITSFNTRLSEIQDLDLSGYTNMSGVINASQHVNQLDSIILPTTSNIFTSIQVNDQALAFVDFTVLSGVNNNITITIQGNGMTAAAVNETLVDLDGTGWTGGTIFIGGTNASPDTTSGGFNGSAAKTSLEGKAWTVNV